MGAAQPDDPGAERGRVLRGVLPSTPPCWHTQTATVVVTYRGTHDDGYGNCIAAAWDAPLCPPAWYAMPRPPLTRNISFLWSTFSVLWGSFTSQVAIAVKH